MKLPNIPFQLFGAGNRRKLLYRQGTLSDALTGERLHDWSVTSERLIPEEYRVELTIRGNKKIVIFEDASGVSLERNGHQDYLTQGKVNLPRFEGHPQAGKLRILHHELLTNIVNGAPTPNLFAYSRPWYRDAALVCMCLNLTRNLHLVEPWIARLSEPFDRNNAGQREPDNLGQVLYMISLTGDAFHPLVPIVLSTIAEFRKGKFILGMTDFEEHPVYQTKWLKFGLRSLGLDDPYQIPSQNDNYSALFWMDFRSQHVAGEPFPQEAKEIYPYLGWAEAHFHNWQPPLDLLGDTYPLTWEAQASQANYASMVRIAPEYVTRKICAPHGWHAAEAFLMLSEGAKI
jgi:hypothetical protein